MRCCCPSTQVKQYEPAGDANMTLPNYEHSWDTEDWVSHTRGKQTGTVRRLIATTSSIHTSSNLHALCRGSGLIGKTHTLLGDPGRHSARAA